MPDINAIAVVAATIAAFLIGGAYYATLGASLPTAAHEGTGAPPPAPWTYAAELGRCLIVALVVAGLTANAEIDAAAGGLLLGLALWVGFPFVLWIGAIVHERTPLKVAALHAGDWLVKLPAVGALIGGLQ